jgi:hypothetical protein
MICQEQPLQSLVHRLPKRAIHHCRSLSYYNHIYRHCVSARTLDYVEKGMWFDIYTVSHELDNT